MGKYIDDITFHLLCGHTDCIYAGTLGSKKAYCNYMDIMKHKRPCRPTAECICYESKKGKK